MPRASLFLERLLGPGRLAVLAVLLMLTAALAIPALGVGVEQDNDSMVARDPQRLADYARLRSLFGNDEQLLLSVGYPDLLSAQGVALVGQVTTRVAALDGVAHVWSLANASYLVPGPWGAEERPLAEAEDLAAVLDHNPHFEGLLISPDRRTAGVVIEIEHRSGDRDYRRGLIDSLRALKRDYSGRAELHLTGVGVQKNDVARFIERDQSLILPLVVGVLALLLALVFRHPTGVLLPLTATGVSMLWTMGCYGLAGLQLNTITSLLPPVIMVLAVSTSVHLYNGWLKLEGEERERIPLLAAKVRELFTPCLFTSLTTALGLLSLSISNVPAVQQFGLFAALGVVFAFLVSMTLVPVWLSFQRLVVEPRRRDGFGLLRRTLEAVARLTFRYPVWVVLLALLLVVVSLAGIPKIRNNTDLVAFLKQDAPLAVDTRHIDQQLGGVNSLEFMLDRHDGHPLTRLDDYQRLARFEARLREEPKVSGVLSLLTLLRPLQRAESGGDSLVLPDNQDELELLLELLTLSPDQQLVRKFMASDRATTRLSVRLPIIGSQDAVALTWRLQRLADEVFGEGYRLTPSGSFYQVASDSNGLVSDMLRSFSLSLTLVMLSILVLLRSLRLTLLALIPNLIPILWAVGLMGYAGIDLSTGTAMIGAVVIGLAVDDTIHYLVNYRRVFSGEPSRAVFATTTGTGKALTISSLVLALGFWVGCLGSFWPTIYFSLLVGGTLLAALLCDLVVLPAVLVLNCPRRKELLT